MGSLPVAVLSSSANFRTEVFLDSFLVRISVDEVRISNAKTRTLHDVPLRRRPNVMKREARHQCQIPFGCLQHFAILRPDHRNPFHSILERAAQRLQLDHITQAHPAQAAEKRVAMPSQRHIAHSPRSRRSRNVPHRVPQPTGGQCLSEAENP
jgi:hypothetical protein